MSIVTLTSKVNRTHPSNIVNMYAKFDEDARNGFVAIVFTMVITMLGHSDFDLEKKYGSSSHHGWQRCTQRFSLYRVSKVIYMSNVTLTSKINRVHPCVRVNMSAKFDEARQTA